MKKLIAASAIMSLCTVCSAVQAAEVVPITANEAFDSVARQIDPLTGAEATVALIDVRTAAEIFWVGAPARVDSIVTVSGETIIPADGKVRIHGAMLTFAEEGDCLPWPHHLRVSRVAEYHTSPVALNIPYVTWDDETATKPVNSDFKDEVEALADQGVDTVILMCRSGKRSTKGGEILTDGLFKTVYEIDQPDGTNGHGGFQGTSYHDHYNGHRGYPGKKTGMQESPSVSWMDAGLPVHIGWNPYQ